MWSELFVFGSQWFMRDYFENIIKFVRFHNTVPLKCTFNRFSAHSSVKSYIVRLFSGPNVLVLHCRSPVVTWECYWSDPFTEWNVGQEAVWCDEPHLLIILTSTFLCPTMLYFEVCTTALGSLQDLVTWSTHIHVPFNLTLHLAAV